MRRVTSLCWSSCVFGLAGVAVSCLVPPKQTGSQGAAVARPDYQAPTSRAGAKYTWRSVPMLGGGFVTGVVMSSAERGLVYARTDVGGAYRWEPAARRWSPITDHLGRKDNNLLGVESIALDPSDPNKLYLRSDDRGASCVRINDAHHQFGGGSVIIGDPRVYGRAYVGTSGRGILYGEPG